MTQRASTSGAEPNLESEDLRLPPIVEEADILHPSYVRLSTVPAAPRPVMTPRRAQPKPPAIPGPGAYETGLPWGRGTVKMCPQSPGNPKRESRRIDVPYYDLPSQRGSARTIGARAAPEKPPAVPGPGEYDTSAVELASIVQKRLALSSTECTFGSPHKVKKPGNVPGPGTYDVVSMGEPKVEKSPRGALLVSRVPPPVPKETPGPGAYEPPSSFSPRHGAMGITLKGRLPHAMSDKNAAHDCAKSSNFHDPSKRHKASPHGY